MSRFPILESSKMNRHLLDQIKKDYNLRTDSQLAMKLDSHRGDIAHYRAETRAVTPRVILLCYEVLGMPVKDVRDLIALGRGYDPR